MQNLVFPRGTAAVSFSKKLFIIFIILYQKLSLHKYKFLE